MASRPKSSPPKGKAKPAAPPSPFTRQQLRAVDAMDTDELQARLVLMEAREDLWAFRRFMFPRMLLGWWQLELAQAMQWFFRELEAGRRPKLLIQAPRQHGKSRVVVEFLAWMAGRNPDLRTIYASYSDRLGVRANKTLQRIFASPRFQLVFPDTRIQMSRMPVPGQPGAQTTQEIIEYIGREGSFRNTTVAGSVNGESLEIGILDDPLKGRKEANSQAMRDQVWNWFAVDFLGCFADNAGLLVIATRRHIDDPTGRMQKKFGVNMRVVSHPALATEDEPHRKAGEALFPELKSREFLEGLRAVMPPDDWAATMQQDPRVIGGNIIKGEWFGRYTFTPLLKWRSIYADTAQKTKEHNDYSVFQCWGKGEDGKIYLLDQLRGKWIAGELKRKAIEFWNKHLAFDDPHRFGQLRRMVIEDKSSGTGLIQELQHPPPTAPGHAAQPRIPVHGMPRGTDRYTRCQDVLGYIEGGYVMLPATASFTNDVVTEAEAFTADDSHDHDDTLDPLFDAIQDMLAKPSAAERFMASL